MADDGGKASAPSSSVDQVMFNDDLLIEILLRLPITSLFCFKSVSKHWLSLITSPAFLNLRVTRFPNISPPSGLFLQEGIFTHFKRDFASFDSRIPAGKKKKSSAFTFGCFGSDASKVRVLQSCNGLVLCVVQTNTADKIYVYNPSINMSRMLPQVDGYKILRSFYNMGLAFDPTKSPHYKVLFVPPTSLLAYSVQTQIYSSETGGWRKSGYSFPAGWFYGFFESGVYWNDALHWLDHATYRFRHFKLDVELPPDITTERLETNDALALPWLGDTKREYKLFESRGCLLLACTGPIYPKPLEIYEMRNAYSGWSLKYTVKYEDAIPPWKMSPVGFRFNVLFIVVGEREEESFVVLNANGMVGKYNLLSKSTLRMPCDFVILCMREFRTFPFIASFADV